MFLVYGGAIVAKQMILVQPKRHEGEKNKVYLIFDPVRAAPAAEHGEITFWRMGLSMYIMYCTCQNQEYKYICGPPATNHILSGWVRRLLLQGFECIMLLYDRISKIIYHEIAWYTGSKQSNRDSLIIILDHKPQRVVLPCPTQQKYVTFPIHRCLGIFSKRALLGDNSTLSLPKKKAGTSARQPLRRH